MSRRTYVVILVVAIVCNSVSCRNMPTPPDNAVSLDRDVFIQRLAPNVWRHVTYRHYPGVGTFPSNGLVVRGDRGALLIDTAWTPEQTALVLDWVEANVGAVAGLLITHAHDDRMGGLSEVRRRGIESAALPQTIGVAKSQPGPEIDTALASGSRLDRFGVVGELYFPGAGHTVDNAVVHLEEVGIVVGSCMIRSHAATTLGNTREADLESWPGAVANLRARYPRAQIVVPGHGEPGGIELFDHTIALLDELL